MGSFICDGINNKNLRRFLRVVFFIVGILPYMAIIILVKYMWESAGYLLDLPTYLTIKSVINHPHYLLCSFSVVGGWTIWYIFCKFVKYVVVNYRTKWNIFKEGE